jgi:1-deoxy-D-xylulose-5-phosphate synthase
MDRAGLVGGDGAVHHGFLDIAYLRSLPGMTLMAAMDEPTLNAAMRFMADLDEGPSALRYPRDKVPTPPFEEKPPAFQLGKANLLAEGNELAILAYGFPANAALQAREQLDADGHSVAVYDARFAKPIDLDVIRERIEAGTPILTVEDHATIAGFGTAVLEAAAEAGLDTRLIHRIGLPDRFIHQAGRDEQLADAGLDVKGIARKAREILAGPSPSIEVAAASTKQATR